MSTTGQIAPNNSGLTPLQIIQTYSDEEWEAFIAEWAEGFDPQYAKVVKLGGPGDKGRDVVGHVTDPSDRTGDWDNYQCKRYGHALTPTDVYPELAKLCVYTHDGSYTKPRGYRFVAPFGVGVKLYDLLRNPNRLRAELIANWEKHCRDKFGAQPVELTDSLLEYVVSFDFSIVGFLTPSEIVSQHERTKYWHRRFKIDPPVRPATPPAPKDVLSYELPYVRSLLDAYGDHLHHNLASPDDLEGSPRIARHFKRSRGYFFSAEALGRFSRDHFEADAFEKIKQHVYDGVIDTVEADHDDGFVCVQKVTELSVSLVLPDSSLEPYVDPSDRKGLCHHLANDRRLRWCRDAD